MRPDRGQPGDCAIPSQAWVMVISAAGWPDAGDGEGPVAGPQPASNASAARRRRYESGRAGLMTLQRRSRLGGSRLGQTSGVDPSSADDVEELLEQGRCRKALTLGLRGLEAGSQDGRLLAAVSEAALRTGDLTLAVDIARRATALRPHSSGLHFRLAQVLQFVDELEAADAAFRRAAELDPRHHIIPVRVDAAAFDELAAETVASLPADLSAVLDERGTAISVKPLPGLDGIVEDNLDPFALGYHFSNPLGLPHSGWARGSVPDAIELYQLSIENWCGSEARLRDEIRRTVLHEMGHAFGMNHADLDEAGY